MIISNPIERKRFLKFMVVGVFGAVVDFGIFNLLTRLFLIAPIPSSIVSFISAVIHNFIWNRYWTYPDSRKKPLPQQLSEFALVNVIGLLIRTPLFALVERYSYNLLSKSSFSFESIDLKIISNNFGLAVAVVVVMFWNFYINRYWTYRDVDTIQEKTESEGVS